jgi:hypothetical protein
MGIRFALNFVRPSRLKTLFIESFHVKPSNFEWTSGRAFGMQFPQKSFGEVVDGCSASYATSDVVHQSFLEGLQ